MSNQIVKIQDVDFNSAVLFVPKDRVPHITESHRLHEYPKKQEVTIAGIDFVIFYGENHSVDITV